MAEFIYPVAVHTVDLWTCPTCRALVYRKYSLDHIEWHRTLTNRPREEGT